MPTSLPSISNEGTSYPSDSSRHGFQGNDDPRQRLIVALDVSNKKIKKENETKT